jgi:hypothetical protein
MIPWYEECFGLKLTDLTQWSAINELRLVNNVTKHAEGHSADELRKLRPEMYVPPALRVPGANDPAPPWPVSDPLAGEGLYVTERDLRSYCDASTALLLAVAEHFEAHASRSFPLREPPRRLIL